MLSKNQKADVLANVSIELVVMFGTLHRLYSRPGFERGLPELEKIENYLVAKLIEYDPTHVKFFTAKNV